MTQPTPDAGHTAESVPGTLPEKISRGPAEVNDLVARNTPLALWVLKRLRNLEDVRRLGFDDTRQLAMIGLWKAARFWRPDAGAKFSTWAVRIVRQTVFAAARKRRQCREVPFSCVWAEGDFAASVPARPDGAREVPADADRLGDALGELPGRDQVILRAIHFEGLPLKEIAPGLRVSRARVQQLHARALKRLEAIAFPPPDPEPDTTPTRPEDTDVLTLTPQKPANHLLRVEEVAKRISVAQRSIWRWVAQGNFPAPMILSATVRRWRSEDVEAWIAARLAEAAAKNSEEISDPPAVSQ